MHLVGIKIALRGPLDVQIYLSISEGKTQLHD